MATTFVDVLLQLRDELGADVLAGGKIYTYAGGTSTPLVTYQALNGTPNTNPVILDSSGMAVIRQTDGVSYKWIVFDADDNELWSRDHIIVGVSASASDSQFLVHMSFSGSPGAQAMMSGIEFDRSVTFPIDFEGASGTVLTSPGSNYTVSIRKNSVEIGTAVIASTGVWTFATTGGVTVSYAAGDYMTFIAPDSGTAADFMAVIPGAVA